MFDPLYFIFWPGAIAVAGALALPVTMGLRALERRFGRGRNQSWELGYEENDWAEYLAALDRDHGPTAYVFRCRKCQQLGGYSDHH